MGQQVGSREAADMVVALAVLLARSRDSEKAMIAVGSVGKATSAMVSVAVGIEVVGDEIVVAVPADLVAAGILSAGIA